MKKTLAVFVLPCAALVALSGAADAGTSRGSATLYVSTSDGVRVASDAMTVDSSLVFSGCGYAPGVGVTVTVQSPSALSFFGGPADANGCFSTAETEVYYAHDAGSYTAKAYQSSKKRADASVSFTVAP